MLNLSQFCELALPFPHPLKAFAAKSGSPNGSRQPSGPHQANDRLAQVLVIGDDSTLLYTRCKILEGAGYVVKTARSALVVEELFLDGIELVLLCHTIPEEVAAHLMHSFTRLAPQIGVLRISALNNPGAGEERAPFVQARPGALLDAVAATLSHH